MHRAGWRILIGSLLVVGGIVFLLENMNIVSLGDIFWGIVLTIVGIGFVVFYFRNKPHWWALIPGFILITLGSQLFVEFASPGFGETYGDIYTLAGFAVSFFAVYVAAPYNWWAIIPGGVLLSLAGINLLEVYVSEGLVNVGGGFFLGLGFTFLLVYVLPSPNSKNTWAIFPALALLLLGVLVLISSEEVINYIWPMVLIALGLVLIVRNVIFNR
jgi:hypothetical protein